MSDTDAEHRCLVGVEDCGCIHGVTVLGYHDADAYKDAALWAKRGAHIENMTVAAFKALPLRCPIHPDGKWDSRGRVRPAQQPTLFGEPR